MWEKPDDLELLEECSTLPETMLLEGLLRASGIDFIRMKDSDTKTSHLFGGPLLFKDSVAKPYKILVRPEDLQTAQELINSNEFEGDEFSFEEDEDE
jgi:hypothetical protein